jgi:hypothetical protein
MHSQREFKSTNRMSACLVTATDSHLVHYSSDNNDSAHFSMKKSPLLALSKVKAARRTSQSHCRIVGWFEIRGDIGPED